MNNDQINIKEYQEAKDLIKELSDRVDRGEILSMLVLSEMTSGDMLGATTSTQNQFAVAGYMVLWAMRRLGLTTFDDVRMMMMGEKT